MAHIKQTISAAPGILTPIIVVLYKTSAPTSEYARLTIPTPHTAPYIYEFSSVDPDIYNVKHYSTPDGTTLGTVLKDFFCDSVTNTILSERRFYVVGGPGAYDPVDSTDNITDPYFDGKTISGIFQEGFRYLKDAVEWRQDPGGVLKLLSGILNNSGMTWAVEISYQQTIATPGTNDTFSIIDVVTGDVTLNSGNYNHTILVTSSPNKQTTTLPLIGTVPDGKGFVVVHDRGNAINVIVKAQSGEVIRFRGQDKNQVVLGIGEVIKIIKKGSKYYVLDLKGQWERVGEFIGWYSNLKDNFLPLSGGEVDPVTYVRLGEFVDSLDPSLVVDYAAFDSTIVVNGETVYHKRGFFAKDAGTGKIKLPDLSAKGIRYLKNYGGGDSDRADNIPGGYQHDRMRDHNHKDLQGEDTSHGGSSSALTGTVRLLVNSTGGNVITVANSKTGGVVIGGVDAFGADTHGKNIGMLPLLAI